MRGGILIVGSLAWDESSLRQKWREERLCMDQAVQIPVPIRYGRRSESRDNTFTMVFSADHLAAGRGKGVGLAVPLRAEVATLRDLVAEGVELWRVERMSTEKPSPEELCARWGSVGLLANPDSSEMSEILEGWAKAVSRSSFYGELPTARDESAVLGKESGLAAFPWPQTTTSGRLLPLEFLFFTATAAEITHEGRYVSPRAVAQAWRQQPHRAEYFWKNREFGIETADDSIIEDELRSQS